jgi:Fe-S-cluster containining protein
VSQAVNEHRRKRRNAEIGQAIGRRSFLEIPFDIMSDSNNTTDLARLYHRIDRRVDLIISEQTNWPCHKGCDLCCRRLAEPPAFTPMEWNRLWPSFLALDRSTQETIGRRVSDLASARTKRFRHYTCPFLERDQGACLIYANRPAACRMYGFYVSRGSGRWCQTIEQQHGGASVMWGNHDAVDRELHSRFGEPADIVDWFSAYLGPDNPA